MRILFAEDDRDLSRAVKALLEHSGYSVDVVDNGTRWTTPRAGPTTG